MSVTVKRFPQGPIEANTYLVIDDDTAEAVVIDAGDCCEALVSALSTVKLRAILLTHGHFDHILGIPALKEKTGAPVYIHEKDAICLKDESYSLCTIDRSCHQTPIMPDKLLHDGDTISFGNTVLRVMHTPGHTPGCVCYIEENERLIFSGDTLFCLTAGRTDLKGGNAEDLLASLIRLSKLEGDYTIYPGHNRDTTLDYERTHNRYMRRFAK